MNRVPFVVSVFVLLLGGCASSIAPAAPPATPFITLEKEAEGAGWRATWNLDRPTGELRFEREGAAFRTEAFEVLTPGFTFQRDGDREVLRSDGEPSATISVRFVPRTLKLEKEYELAQLFSDGSVAIYTGHFVARTFAAGDVEECTDCFIRRFKFIGPPATPVVVDGRVQSSPFEWSDEQQQGTYVYFGNLAPVQSKEMISIIDPALPDWLEDEAKSALPQLFAMYTERFGVALPVRPTILFSYSDSGHSGYSNKGGTLPGQIQLTVDGAAWGERSEEALRNLLHFLAHEAVHLWNGQVIHYAGTEDSWMHEGSADGLAERTLLELGLIDDEMFLAYQSAALNECRKGLAGFPLRDAAKRNDFSLYYSCGNALSLATEAATRDHDLFAFWQRLIARTQASGEFDSDDYFAVWQESGAKGEALAALRSFAHERAGADDLAALLAGQGVEMVDTARPPRGYGQSLARNGLLVLASEHCRQGYSFNASPTGFLLSKSKECGELPAGSLVTSIGGHDVMSEGESVWDALHAACGSGTTVPVGVTLDGASRSVQVACSKPVAARLPYLTLTARPRPASH